MLSKLNRCIFRQLKGDLTSLYKKGQAQLILRVLIVLVSVIESEAKSSDWPLPPDPILLNQIGNAPATVSIEDQLGYLWIGTQYNLNRFDGYKVKSFKHDKKDTKSMSGAWVKSLTIDSGNHLWVGIKNAGVSRYNPSTGEFLRFASDKNNPNTLPSNNIDSVLYDQKSKVIWVATYNGLAKIEESSLKISTYYHTPDDSHKRNDSFMSLNLFEDRLLLGHSWGLSYFDWSTQSIKSIPITLKNGDPLNDGVLSIHQSQDGILWLGTNSHGLGWIDKNNQFNKILFDKNKNSRTSRIVTILPVGKELWIGTYGSGIVIVDKVKKQVKSRIFSSRKHRDSGKSFINSIYKDRSGLIWVSTIVGIFKLNPNARKFTYLKQNDKDEQALTSQNIISILERKNGEIWVSFLQNGIDILSPNLKRIRSMKPDKNRKNWFATNFFSMAEDETGSIWLGSTGRGLFQYNQKRNKFINFTQGLHSLGIDSLKVAGDRLWIGTWEGLNYMDLNTQKIHTIRDVTNYQLMENTRIFDMAMLPDKSLWAATSKGLFAIPHHLKFLMWFTNKTESSMSTDVYSDLSVDSSGTLWMQTKSGGIDKLVYWDGETARFESLNELKIVPTSLYLSNIISDSDNNLWTAEGWLNTKNNQFTPLQNVDGVNNESGVWNRSQAKTKTGQILLGSMDSIIYFDPREITRWNYEPPLVATEFKVNNKVVYLKDNSFILTPEDKEFSVEFSSLDFLSPQENLYAYKLEGYNSEWVKTDSDHRVAKFMNLPPGNYQLKIKGTNRLQDWSEKSLNIKIKQLPTWYQKIWFKVFIALLFLAIAFAASEYRARLLKKRTKKLKELVDDKTRDIKSILEAIQQGILAIEDDLGTVGNEHSEFLTQLTGTGDIAGNNFYELIFKGSNFNEDQKSQIMGAIKSSVGEDELGFMMNSHLFPREAIIEKEGKLRVYELDWNPILKGNTVRKILLVIRDVTSIRELEKTSNQQRQEMKIVQEIINVPVEKFDSMLTSCYEFISENKQIIHHNSCFELEAVRQLFRNMHTMKGLARSYQLYSLSDAAHIAEQFYSKYLHQQEWSSAEMLEALDKAKQIVDNYQKINIEKLGRTPEDANKIEVDLDTVTHNLELLTGIDSVQFNKDAQIKYNSIKSFFIQLISSPLDRILEDQIKASASLARQLQKEEPKVRFDDPGFSISRNCHELMVNVFNHLIRNSIDHGLESAEERIKLGKNPQGELKFSLGLKFGQLQITYSDDGRGLNLKQIYQSALKTKILSDQEAINPQKIADLIFESGFSTAEKLTDISGRGVGMDAVKSFLEEENCSITINIINQSRELDYSPFEFVITLPSRFFQLLSTEWNIAS